MAFLELKDIRKAYYLDKQKFPVLKGIDLSFERGEFDSWGIRWWKVYFNEYHWGLRP